MHDILVHTEELALRDGAMRFAARWAARQQGALTGVYVCPAPLMVTPPLMSPELIGLAIDAVRAHEVRAESAGPEFLAWAKREGVREAHWQVAEGPVPEVLGHLCNRHDALVLGRGDGIWNTPGAVGRLVLSVNTPCFVVPANSDLEACCGRVALAWNGTPEAMRAIHSALPLLKQADHLLLLRGNARDPYFEGGWRPPFEIADYLTRHGLHFDQSLIEDDANAGGALLSACQRASCDLLVMGAYGRTRLSEWIFGGATHELLGRAPLPLLLHG